jgi:hypothetical protein
LGGGHPKNVVTGTSQTVNTISPTSASAVCYSDQLLQRKLQSSSDNAVEAPLFPATLQGFILQKLFRVKKSCTRKFL